MHLDPHGRTLSAQCNSIINEPFVISSQAMRQIEFTPRGICARSITIMLDDDNKVQDLSFVGGCDGNHKGLRALIKGMTADEAIERLSGITCGFRPTSCPDQVAVALKQALNK